jgi:hypothetical protein
MWRGLEQQHSKKGLAVLGKAPTIPDIRLLDIIAVLRLPRRTFVARFCG